VAIVERQQQQDDRQVDLTDARRMESIAVYRILRQLMLRRLAGCGNWQQQGLRLAGAAVTSSATPPPTRPRYDQCASDPDPYPSDDSAAPSTRSSSW